MSVEGRVIKTFHLWRDKHGSMNKSYYDSDGTQAYRKRTDFLGARKRLISAKTDATVWEQCWFQYAFLRRRYYNSRTKSIATLNIDTGLHFPTFQFEWEGKTYTWQNRRPLTLSMQCYEKNTENMLADFRGGLHWKLVGRLRLFLPGKPTADLEELLMICLIDMLEMQILLGKFNLPEENQTKGDLGAQSQ
ncbi:hypothetical protein H4R33_000284 [Dimargaris cristalligena]|nr:hypothetical protein H4R33_000284 [Dimargaris cristalligena]